MSNSDEVLRRALVAQVALVVTNSYKRHLRNPDKSATGSSDSSGDDSMKECRTGGKFKE
uniref:Uncharacterized protein n=1 Tax=Ditylenchus dipsaci TaxID=166011 RepID=A0A915CNB6_9BILA